MNQHQSTTDEMNTTVSLKQLILHFKELVGVIWSRKLWVFLSIAAFLILGIILSIQSDRQYHSKFTFIIDDQSSSPFGGGIGDLIGNFGLGGFGTSYSFDKILGMAKSQNIVSRTLLKKVSVDGQMDYLGNHFIDYFKQEKDWVERPWYVKPFKEKDPLEDFKFQSGDSTIVVDKDANRALYNLHYRIVGSKDKAGLLNAEYGETSLILQLDILLKNEELAYHFINELYGSLRDYYVEKSIEKHQVTYDILATKADSIYTALKSDEYALANFSETYRNLVDKRDNVRKTRLNREVQKNSILYAEVLKNVEFADFALKNNTPFIQELDAPNLPLPNGKLSLFKALVLGGILGTIIPVLLILMGHYYRQIMKS